LNIKEAVTQFIRFLETSGRSQATIRTYSFQLSKFVQFFGENQDVASLSHDAIIRFLKAGQKKRFSDATLNTVKASLASLFGYLLESDHIQKVPFKKLRYDKIVRKMPRVLNPGEQGAVLAAADHGPGLLLLLRVYIDWGLRLSEALKLDIGDVEGADVVRIIGKGKRVRKLPLTPGIREALSRWIPIREKRLAAIRRKRGTRVDNKSLFLTKWGTRPKPRTAQAAIKSLLKSVGLTDVRVHNLRHTLGKRLADAGVHIRTIQDILGHADSSTVEIYTPTTRSDISDALNLIKK
jgi:site-specific recombinase XerD